MTCPLCGSEAYVCSQHEDGALLLHCRSASMHNFRAYPTTPNPTDSGSGSPAPAAVS